MVNLPRVAPGAEVCTVPFWKPEPKLEFIHPIVPNMTPGSQLNVLPIQQLVMIAEPRLTEGGLLRTRVARGSADSEGRIAGFLEETD